MGMWTQNGELLGQGHQIDMGRGKHHVAWVWVPFGASINVGNDKEEHVGPEVNRKSRGIAQAVCY